MDKHIVIKNIISIPSRFHGNGSFVSMLKESGYLESHNNIQEEDIFEVLKNCPEEINQWIG